MNILTVSTCVSTVLFFELLQGACAKRYIVGGLGMNGIILLVTMSPGTMMTGPEISPSEWVMF